MATHHAVWHALDGSLVDVTPFHPDDCHHPITAHGSVLFLVDRSALPTRHGLLDMPLPLNFFPITESEDMRLYVQKLTVEEQQKCQAILEEALRDLGEG